MSGSEGRMSETRLPQGRWCASLLPYPLKKVLATKERPFCHAIILNDRITETLTRSG